MFDCIQIQTGCDPWFVIENKSSKRVSACSFTPFPPTSFSPIEIESVSERPPDSLTNSFEFGESSSWSCKNASASAATETETVRSALTLENAPVPIAAAAPVVSVPRPAMKLRRFTVYSETHRRSRTAATRDDGNPRGRLKRILNPFQCAHCFQRLYYLIDRHVPICLIESDRTALRVTQLSHQGL